MSDTTPAPLPNSGIPQPHGGVLHPFQPGQSGNPAGRPPNGGRSLRERCNDFLHQGLLEAQLVKIAKNKKAPPVDRAAAIRILRQIEDPDLADFTPLLTGKKSLSQLRATGVRTNTIKKFKQKSRMVPDGKDGYEEVIEREIELHDRSRDEFKLLVEQTDGTPEQTISVNNEVHINAVQIIIPGLTPPSAPPPLTPPSIP